LEDDEARILRLLDIPRTRAEISETTGLEDERLRTVLQMLKRNDLAQLTEGKRWTRTELGTKKLEEEWEEEEPEEGPEPPRKESLTRRFEANRRRRDLLKLSGEISSTLDPDWGWERDLLKDVESMKEDINFIDRSLNEADSMEELEELAGLLEKVDKSWDDLFVRNNELSEKRRKIEKDRKMGRVREFYHEEYPDLPEDYLEEILEKLGDDPERFNEIYQRMEREEHLEHLLEQAVEYGLHPDFVRYVSEMAKPEKLELDYILKIWDEYDEISCRCGSKVARGFLDYHGPSLLKRKGDLLQMFQRYMPHQRSPSPVY
jgi:hypothetical protein